LQQTKKVTRLTEAASIQEYIRSKVELIETALRTSFPEAWDTPPRLAEAMNYSLLAGGKRLRPVLVLAAAESLGASIEGAVPVACAVEMIHTYSLIHDDLPAMDNDDYRRGRPTNHRVYGEAMAILAGDGLLTHAFYSASQAAKHGIPADRVLAIIEELSNRAGIGGMVGGQVADMLGEQGITLLADLEYIHLHKTSDLIIFSLKAGGIVGGGNPNQLQALETFGRCIGLAFQIQDDILDVIGDESKLGKPVKSDEKQHKVTYPFFIGLEASQEKVRQLTEEGKRAILEAQFPYPERLLQLADYMMNRDH
jgi:geranylgeranyl diphosphate synthase, type II